MSAERLSGLTQWLDRQSGLTQWVIAVASTVAIAYLISPLTRKLPFYVGVGLTATILAVSVGALIVHRWRRRK